MTTKALQDPTPADPKAQDPRPEYPQRPIDPPGSDAEMTPQADHGEHSYRGLGRLTGHAALITGGGSGIGRAVAIALAREGGDIALSYMPEEEDDAQETRRWGGEAGGRSPPPPPGHHDGETPPPLVE